MKIRKEERADYNEVYNLVKLAFESAEHSDGNEHNLVQKLRKSNSFVPELSLVAVDDGIITGHIMYTKLILGNRTELALAPLSVHPSYQKKGIGSALIKASHNIAKELGYNFSVVLGSELYYPKFGYVPASTFGIKSPFEVPDLNFMACSLSENPEILNVTARYAKEMFK